MIQELLLASQSVQALGTLLKAANGLANYNEIVSAVSEVNSKLMQANAVALASQEKQATLANQVATLQAELSELKRWDNEIDRYILHQLAPEVFVYALKPGRENAEPPHFLCTNCVSKHQKSILQLTNSGPYGRDYICHNCSSQLSFSTGRRPPTQLNTDYDMFNT